MARLLRRGTGLERFARRREPQGSRGFSDLLLIACTAPRQRRRSRPHSYVYGAGSAGGLAVPRRCEGRARSLLLLEGLAYDGPLLWHSRRREVALSAHVSRIAARRWSCQSGGVSVLVALALLRESGGDAVI